jgi:hypothetical protein
MEEHTMDRADVREMIDSAVRDEVAYRIHEALSDERARIFCALRDAVPPAAPGFAEFKATLLLIFG